MNETEQSVMISAEIAAGDTPTVTAVCGFRLADGRYVVYGKLYCNRSEVL